MLQSRVPGRHIAEDADECCSYGACTLARKLSGESAIVPTGSSESRSPSFGTALLLLELSVRIREADVLDELDVLPEDGELPVEG